MRLSMAIRMPASHDRLLNSANIDISHFEEWDIRHVRERFPDAEEEIVRRLATAISRRRQYFRYRSNHARNFAYEPMSKYDGRTEYQPQSTIASSLPEAIKNTPHLVDLETEENSDTAVSQTSFATSTGDSTEGPRVPPPPRRAKPEEPFECPFCFMLVSIRTRKSWKYGCRPGMTYNDGSNHDLGDTYTRTSIPTCAHFRDALWRISSSKVAVNGFNMNEKCTGATGSANKVVFGDSTLNMLSEITS